MEDIILVSGVLYLRPPAGREDEKISNNGIFAVRPPAGESEEDGILCDGLIEFRSSAAKPAGATPYKKQFGVIPDEEAAGDEGSMG